MTAMRGLTVVETAERVVGEYCAKLLADFGAEVIKIERPGGSPTRAFGPHVNGASAVFAYCNSNKKSVVIDLADPAGRERLSRLLARADALIDDHDPAWCSTHGLSPDEVREAHPDLVHCAITPFGQDAPADKQNAWPINVMHAGGWAWHTPSEADPSDPPLKGAGRFMPDYDAGLDAAIATAASLYRKRRTGKGQFIDQSEVETQLSRADIVIGRCLGGDDDPTHARTRYDMGGPGASFACADGFVHIYMTTSKHWNGLKEIMGNPAWAEAFPDDWLEFHCTADRVTDFRDNFRPWIAEQARVRISEQAQKRGVPLVPVNNAADLLANEQYRHRGFFQKLAHPELGEALYPTVPYRMTGSPAQLDRPAPAIGQDDAEMPA